MELLTYEPDLSEILNQTTIEIEHCSLMESESVHMSGETYEGISLDVNIEIEVEGSSEIDISDHDVCKQRVWRTSSPTCCNA